MIAKRKLLEVESGVTGLTGLGRVDWREGCFEKKVQGYRDAGVMLFNLILA